MATVDDVRGIGYNWGARQDPGLRVGFGVYGTLEETARIAPGLPSSRPGTQCGRSLCLGSGDVARTPEEQKEFRRQYMREYAASHREEIRVRMASYYAERRELWAERTAEQREQRAARRSERKEERAIYNAAYHAKHREERILYRREYRKEHPEIGRAYRGSHREERKAHDARRRTRQLGAEGTHTASDIRTSLSLQRGRCWWCGRPITKGFHSDHRIPLSRGGSNGPENLVLSCPRCNLSKGTKTPQEFAGRLL